VVFPIVHGTCFVVEKAVLEEPDPRWQRGLESVANASVVIGTGTTYIGWEAASGVTETIGATGAALGIIGIAVSNQIKASRARHVREGGYTRQVDVEEASSSS